jgi:hypothetical protein
MFDISGIDNQYFRIVSIIDGIDTRITAIHRVDVDVATYHIDGTINR